MTQNTNGAVTSIRENTQHFSEGSLLIVLSLQFLKIAHTDFGYFISARQRSLQDSFPNTTRDSVQSIIKDSL